MAKAYTYFDDDGEPWALIVDGHVPEKHFLAYARVVSKRDCVKVQGKVEHRYMRDCGDDSDTPYVWCDGRVRGAMPVTVIVQPPFLD